MGQEVCHEAFPNGMPSFVIEWCALSILKLNGSPAYYLLRNALWFLPAYRRAFFSSFRVKYRAKGRVNKTINAVHGIVKESPKASVRKP